MISIKHKGDFKNTERFLKKMKNPRFQAAFKQNAERGLSFLEANTPYDTGLSAQSWKYTIKMEPTAGRITLTYSNSNVTDNGTPVVILLQYGHGTAGGTFVQGIDFINPAIRPIFDKIVEDLWEEVVTA